MFASAQNTRQHAPTSNDAASCCGGGGGAASSSIIGRWWLTNRSRFALLRRRPSSWCAGPCRRVNIPRDDLADDTLRLFAERQLCRMCANGGFIGSRRTRRGNDNAAEQEDEDVRVPMSAADFSTRLRKQLRSQHIDRRQPHLFRAVLRKPGNAFVAEKRLYEMYRKPVGLNNDEDGEEEGGGDEEENESGSAVAATEDDADLLAIVMSAGRYDDDEPTVEEEEDAVDVVAAEEEEEKEDDPPPPPPSSSARRRSRTVFADACAFCGGAPSDAGVACANCAALPQPPIVTLLAERRRRSAR